MISEKDKEELRRQSAFMNRWMAECFGAKPIKKRMRRQKPCPYCGEPIGLTKPCCYQCYIAGKNIKPPQG